MDLGDVVTVLNRQWGLTMNTRITEAAEVYEPSQVRIDVTFATAFDTSGCNRTKTKELARLAETYRFFDSTGYGRGLTRQQMNLPSIFDKS
ncbi:hypothetical protein P7H25_08700 [Paenibacillus larvae]|nr:hypothetical protein [Paenibacillus larvae]